jgi:hypothetical protein
VNNKPQGVDVMGMNVLRRNFMSARCLVVMGMTVALFAGGCSFASDSMRETAVPEQSGVKEPTLRIERLPNNPIVTPAMIPSKGGYNNINGPSLIRVPDWVPNPLGKYYLYFAHHRGQYIRLAYADRVEGPWKVYEPGTLRVEDTVCDSVFSPKWGKKKHIASPDVHVDEKSKEIRMYFHCPAYNAGPKAEDGSYNEFSFVATSKDGLDFKARSEILGNRFFRVFQWGDAYYALSMPGVFFRSADGLTDFVKGPTLFTKNMRHSAVKVDGDTLLVFYTVVGTNPESILLSSIPLDADWMTWKETEPRVVLAPEREWEGGSQPLETSKRGPAKTPVRQLRDPALFEDNGRTYLLYSVAGEQGIAIAEVHWQ